ncbi:MAG: DoxX family protein [bacterium]
MRRPAFPMIGRTIGTWLPVILLGLIFIPAGWAKFSDTSGWAVAFRHWGYPDWFRVLIGVLEVGGVVLLLTGRAAAIGAILIIAVMLGGTGTHIVKDNGRHVTSEVVPIFLATVVLVFRRDQLRRLLS